MTATDARLRDGVLAVGSLDFRAGALCATHPPETFFPETHGGHESRADKRAKRICRACPALDACTVWTDANPELTEFGIWSGRTAAERRRALLERIGAVS